MSDETGKKYLSLLNLSFNFSPFSKLPAFSFDCRNIHLFNVTLTRQPHLQQESRGLLFTEKLLETRQICSMQTGINKLFNWAKPFQ